ncbi:MAG: hypothetical protein ABIU77_17060 [Ferruginibacter sp.]
MIHTTNKAMPDTAYADFIELTMVDIMKRKRTVVVLFNLDDEWENDDVQKSDVAGMFAGHIIQIFKKDRRAFAYRANAFTTRQGIIKKSMTFTPMVKVHDEFKECHIYDDGRVTLVD